MITENKDKEKQIIVVSSGVSDGEAENVDGFQALNEFDVQKTAETENLYPAIAQGYPVSGFKDIIKPDNTK